MLSIYTDTKFKKKNKFVKQIYYKKEIIKMY